MDYVNEYDFPSVSSAPDYVTFLSSICADEAAAATAFKTHSIDVECFEFIQM